jgi:hypothetical protein
MTDTTKKYLVLIALFIVDVLFTSIDLTIYFSSALVFNVIYMAFLALNILILYWAIER